MKRLINLILILGVIVFLYSCGEEFFEKEPPGTAAGSVMLNEKGVEVLLVGAYDALNGDAIFGGCMGTDWVYECASDNAYKGSQLGDQPPFNNLERYECLPSNAYMAQRWRDCCNGIGRSNNVINTLRLTQEGDFPIPESRAKEMEGEAKFLRAWYHFKLTKVFRNIPYIKTEEEMGMSPVEVPNTSEGWDEIEADLQVAIDNLPTSPPKGEIGRTNKYAAAAVKAMAHMYQNELNEAEPLLDMIINSNKFGLVDNFRDNYNIHTEHNVESIFEIEGCADASDASYILAVLPTMHLIGKAGRGWGFYQPSYDLFEAYQTNEEGLPVLEKEDRVPIPTDMGIASSEEFHPPDQQLDPRVDWTLARRGIPYLDWGIHEGREWLREQPNGGPFMSKKFMYWLYNDSYTSSGGKRTGYNHRVIRYGSHVLLWKAEILVEKGELDEARNLVNQIRNRAKNSEYVMGRCYSYVMDGSDYDVNYDEPAANYYIEPYPPGADAFSTKEKARKAVRMEIRLETALEGNRFFDLRRWGIDDQVLNDFIAEDVKFRTFMQGATYNPNKNEYWPLPVSQVDLEEGVLEQDPNYQ
jgi:starch-binding outer membrane protein, SusD/RagB family